jgi:hypothetical protein
MTISVAYALTTDGADQHADLNLISAMSVRLNCADCRIVIVCDESSAVALRMSGHRLMSVVDDVISVPTPSGSAGFRNRYVKTRLREAVTGPLLYLDADTLVRGSLDYFHSIEADVASAPNHSGAGIPADMPGCECDVFRQVGWELPQQYYVNGGVHFFADNSRVHAFFDKWHAKWQECSRITGKHFDQPSLNSALSESDLQFSWLPNEFNAQIHARPSVTRDAKIWHFYSSDHHPSPRTHVDRLLQSMLAGMKPELEDVRLVCSRSHPWDVQDMIGTIAVRRLIRQTGMLASDQWERLWLAGQRRDVIRSLCQKRFGIFYRVGRRLWRAIQ